MEPSSDTMSSADEPAGPRAVREGIFWRPRSTVRKWFDPADYEAGKEPDEVMEDEGNVLTTAGATRMLNRLISNASQALDSTHARLGVGNGSTATNSSDTNLTGPLRLFHGMDPAYPQVSGATITFRAVFQDNEANFAWNEWGIDVGGAGVATTDATVVAPFFNHRIPSTPFGTKSGGVWLLDVSGTLA